MVAWRQQKEAREAEKKKASQQDSVESYEAAFQRIKTITGTCIYSSCMYIMSHSSCILNLIPNMMRPIKYECK